jgi:hypothetical protein
MSLAGIGHPANDAESGKNFSAAGERQVVRKAQSDF